MRDFVLYRGERPLVSGTLAYVKASARKFNANRDDPPATFRVVAPDGSEVCRTTFQARDKRIKWTRPA